MSATIIPFPARAVKSRPKISPTPSAAQPPKSGKQVTPAPKPTAAERKEAKKQALREAHRDENLASPRYDGKGHSPPWCEHCLVRPAVTYCHCRGCCGETKLCHPCDRLHAKQEREEWG